MQFITKGHTSCTRHSRPPVAMKLLYVALVLAFGFSGSDITAQVAAKPQAALKTFVSRDGFFRFKYPAEFIVCRKNTSEAACLTYLPICDDNAAACVAYPTAHYEGSNFEGAAFSVNELAQEKTGSECLASMPPPVHMESVNGVKFQAGHQSNAGMGHGLYEDSYRTFHTGQCFELDIRVATASMGGYPPGAIKEFTQEDERRVKAALAKVMSSFKFSKSVKDPTEPLP
ncbi:MAG: hypothetical protein WBX10_09775 [Candidatus Sulfotelmatobacter sp.]